MLHGGVTENAAYMQAQKIEDQEWSEGGKNTDKMLTLKNTGLVKAVRGILMRNVQICTKAWKWVHW